ncbi:S8 family serine peptidase [uncultured Microbacterium sp.]|uniref:S8 family serine peptidase n=1 Tax=uncultured Microbacterium sp. TaxID=191216 RepID=UPI0025D525FF|nr:S8 family serine peptidase [uncultured Microbacterium sp.]
MVTTTPERSRKTRVTASVALSALFIGTALAGSIPATAAPLAEAGGGVTLPEGRYIVVLDEPAAATYDGGTKGMARTQPEAGDKLDASSPAVEKYVSYLEDEQSKVASSVGAKPDATYQVALNGFSANLSGEQATKLASRKGVTGVYPDENLATQATLGTDYLGLSGANGVWAGLGGTDEAGKGVVVGVVDTGIAPENPSFAGAPLGTTPGAEPYLDGNAVVFAKGDGGTFRSERVTGDGWTLDDYSTKIIGAQYFTAGAAAADFPFDADYKSPRDFAGHGSHTASTAAGVNGVDATVNGIDYGKISGVAPAAKIAAYKACYDGPDPDVRTDDICASSDLLAAINAAVKDGVDVINFSIGGGAATSVLNAFDYAFLNAAAAGVFVSASAGNSGPGSSTLDHASPWYTTVANSTLPSETATLTLGDGQKAAGLTIGLPAGVDLANKKIVWSHDAGVSGADPALVAQCQDNTLDPAKVAGAIVVCDRGGNFLYQKSDETKRAGGLATVILNTPASAQTVFGGSYSLPTVHIPSTFYAAITGYISGKSDATASLSAGNETSWQAPAAPVVNSSSSRGPALADGSDVLKPDISAPGTDILAAVAGSPGEPAWDFLTGTSMAAPHVAGLAALYLGEHPTATPAEVKSAIMTTATDTVNEDGSPNTNPFDQGAGHVNARKFLNPGAVYLNGLDDWYAYLQGVGYNAGVDPIDPSDLNLPSIAIGTLAATQTVTRTLTATQAGTYQASINVPGIEATVSPSTVSFANAGDTATFTVTFTATTAPAEEWASGFLTWSGTTEIRSPIAVYPVTAEAPAAVTGTGITGSTDVTITPGVDGSLPLTLSGLAPATLLTDPEFPVAGHSGDQDSFYAEGAQYNNYFEATVPEGAKQARFDLNATPDDTSVDLDLTAYYISNGQAVKVGTSATESADERVVIDDPAAGTYILLVNRYSYSAPFTWDLTSVALVPGAGEGSLAATPNPLTVTRGHETTYSLSWSGLAPSTTYYGLVTYGDSAVSTLLTVDSGAPAPVATAAPTISGKPEVGKTLTATPGTWDPASVTTSYQWLRGGQPIAGATSASYVVAKDDVGTALSVRVTARGEGNPNAGVADSAPVYVKAGSRTEVSLNRYLGTTKDAYVVTLHVAPTAGPSATGTVQLWVNGQTFTATLDGAGNAEVALPSLKRGVYVVIAHYGGSQTVKSSVGASAFIVLR